MRKALALALHMRKIPLCMRKIILEIILEIFNVREENLRKISM